MIRPDFIFSYWIFLWYIFYMFNLTSFSPKFAILLGLLENMFMLFVIYKVGINTIYFIIMFLLLKAIPLYTIRKDTIRAQDVQFTLGLFIVYLIWCSINRLNILEVFKRSVYHKDALYDLPGISLLRSLTLK